MSIPARTHDEDLPPPKGDDPPGVIVWAIAGVLLMLAYVAVLALLRPTA